MPGGQHKGILLINKPKGITSHDVVDIVRARLGTKRVGHAGTLDPLAEGLLIILVGVSTKLFPKFVIFDKKYSGVLKLGEVTLTGDAQGEVVKKSDYRGIGSEEVKKVFDSFQGDIEQVPPMVSALRIKGRRLYDLARKGISVERRPRKVRIYDIQITSIDLPYVEFTVHCSKGTYVRKLAEDIGERLACGAHMVKIVRLAIGPFKIDNAVLPDEVKDSDLLEANI